MVGRPINLRKMIEDKVIRTDLALLGRDTVSYVDISETEANYVNRVFDEGVKQLKKVSPVIAEGIEAQRELVTLFAGVAKATFPAGKDYAFPSFPGSLGVAWLFPQGLKWVATPGPSNPCYTSYKNNSWDIDTTPGAAAYFLGDGTNFYKANPNTDNHTFILIFKDGVIEYGSTPSIEQFRLISQAKTDYGIYTVEPLVEVPVEKNVAIYQYPTPLGALFVSHDRGVMWGFMPRTGGTKTIKLLGLIFYEHDFMASLKWV